MPEEALEAYQGAEVWKSFWYLQIFDPARVENVKADNGSGACYDLRGCRLATPKRGLNIIGGKKVVVR